MDGSFRSPNCSNSFFSEKKIGRFRPVNWRPWRTSGCATRCGWAVAERRCVRVVQLTSAHLVFDPRIFYKISKSLFRAGYEVIVVGRHDRDETLEGIQIAAVPKVGGRLHRM